jgi:hypothetical protein
MMNSRSEAKAGFRWDIPLRYIAVVNSSLTSVGRVPKAMTERNGNEYPMAKGRKKRTSNI